jgi:hypothetical protein
MRAGFVSMGEVPLALRRADRRDHDVIIGLIDAAAEWLAQEHRSVGAAVAGQRGARSPDQP